MLESVLPMFSSKSFIVSGLTILFLISLATPCIVMGEFKQFTFGVIIDS